MRSAIAMPGLPRWALALVVAGLLSACAHALAREDIDFFQPPIVATVAPAKPLRGSWTLANNTTRVGLAAMAPLVPAYAGPGALLASWNPAPGGAAGPA